MANNGASIPQQLFDLAPTTLKIHRTERYKGGGFSVTLNHFAPEDVSLLLRLYQSVKKTYDLWLYMQETPNYDLIRQHIISEFASPNFYSSIHAIGMATYALKEPSPLLRQIVHDIRSGALSGLTGYAEMQAIRPQTDPERVKNAILKARDHAKLMRNAIEDIDPVVRAADESVKVHFIDDFVNKWDESRFKVADKQIDVNVVCTFEGSVTNRCLETSAIDRILYNYLNNASRFTVDGNVTLYIFPINDDVVRWVVENPITAHHKDWLAENGGDNLHKLFEGGVTRGGHGIGLSTCTELVAASFGVSPPMEAVAQQYLGAEVNGDSYLGWFHWPSYYPGDEDDICDCGD